MKRVLLSLLLIAGFVTFMVLNATKKSGPAADTREEGAPGIGADETPLGDTTEHALQAGLVLGVAAQAEGLVARIKSQLEAEEGTSELEHCPVIATGGLSRVIEQATDVFDAIDVDLTLRGIWRIWQAR